jgi:hypothetical protein
MDGLEALLFKGIGETWGLFSILRFFGRTELLATPGLGIPVAFKITRGIGETPWGERLSSIASAKEDPPRAGIPEVIEEKDEPGNWKSEKPKGPFCKFCSFCPISVVSPDAIR